MGTSLVTTKKLPNHSKNTVSYIPNESPLVMADCTACFATYFFSAWVLQLLLRMARAAVSYTDFANTQLPTTSPAGGHIIDNAATAPALLTPVATFSAIWSTPSSKFGHVAALWLGRPTVPLQMLHTICGEPTKKRITKENVAC